MDSIELNNHYVNMIESGNPHSLRILREMEAARSPSERRFIDRIRNELMLPLDDFLEIIASRLFRRLCNSGASSERIRKMREKRLFPTLLVRTELDLHTRIIQFKIGIHTRETLDEFLREYVGYAPGPDMVVFVPSEKYDFSPYNVFGYSCY